MKNTIGFGEKNNKTNTPKSAKIAETKPVRCVVEVFFPCKGKSWAYYNDKFDLHKGDKVFVEGKLNGKRGIVIDVNYNFKIDLSIYKRVIAVADTRVKGTLYFADSHLIAFDRNVIPYKKISSWFKAPANPESEIVSGSDDSSFLLDELEKVNIKPEIIHRGCEYYENGSVTYIELDGENGRVLVEGNEVYELEFTYRNGEISGLICSCFCNCFCKHEVAAMLKLRDILKAIDENYATEFERADYFAAICKVDFYKNAVIENETGSVTLN